MKINLILLASGNSIRFKGNKLLAKIKDKPIYLQVIEKTYSIKFNKIICVTQYDEIKNNLSRKNIQVIINENSILGISESIKLGINHDKKADGYMFMVCDQPFIKTITLQKLINEFLKGDKGIVAVGKDKVIGNPTIFSAKYIRELLTLKGDVGGKKIINQHLDDLKVIQVDDEKELIDIDTRELLAKFSN